MEPRWAQPSLVSLTNLITSEASKSELENKQRSDWLKFKGMDTFDAMKLYIEKVKELAQVYCEIEEQPTAVDGKTAEPAEAK